MIVEAGAAAVICHSVLLLIFGFNNRRILLAMGEGNEGKTPLSSGSMTAFIGVVAYRFMPTVIVASTASSWIGAAYNSEAVAYIFLVVPVCYAVILLMWWITECGRCCDRFARNDDDDLPIGGTGTSKSRNVGKLAPALDSEARMIRKNQEKEHAKKMRQYSGSTLRGSNTDFYAVHPPVSAVEMMAIQEQSLVPSEQSPYIERRKADQLREVDEQIRGTMAVDRQNRINEAFEDYVEAVRVGQDVGLFIVDGEVIPVDEAQRLEIEGVIATRGGLY